MAAQRGVIYCVLRPELADELHDELREFFRDRANVEVIVERRRLADRRSAGSRRGERRTDVARADPPALPPAAMAHRDRIPFVARLEPSTLQLEDRDTARLVRQIQAGEPELFAKLYTRHFDRVYAYLTIALRDTHEAEDATQDVFARVCVALPRYEERGSPFRGWLFQIVRNTAIDRLRRRARSAVPFPDDLLEHVAERSGAADATEWLGDRSWLNVIESLPLPQRQVIALRYVMGLPGREAAAVLGRSPAGERQLHHRAMISLREVMGGSGRLGRSDGGRAPPARA